MYSPRKIIIISAANLHEGGTFSILKDCLNHLDSSEYFEYDIIALVNDKLKFNEYRNIKFIEFKKMRWSYFHRLFYEFIYFYFLSIKLKPYLWFSLNDISSNVKSEKRVVYCHNPSPFRGVHLNDLFDQPKLFFFTLFYKYLYKININKNNFVIVQQHQLKNIFSETFKLPLTKIITATPNIDNIKKFNQDLINESSKKIFFFPTYPRPFKNIEVICEAVLLLKLQNITNFEVIVTIDGTENGYSKRILKKYGHLKNIRFIGSIGRDEVFYYYSIIDFLLFPSKLETWGLPITEFKNFRKPILVSNLGYAIETVGRYDYVNFFNPDDSTELAYHMCNYLKLNFSFDITFDTIYHEPHANSWKNLFFHVLN